MPDPELILVVDKDRRLQRLQQPHPDMLETGIRVRAMLDGQWGSHDILDLDRDSVVKWVRSRGQVHAWGVNIVLHLLGFQGDSMVKE